MSVKVKLVECSGNGDALCCPSCGDFFGLHHEVVEVWDRGEDQRKGTYLRSSSPLIVNAASDVDHVSGSDEARVILQEDGGGRNPSSRRNGMIIHFWCEMCSDKSFELHISQHKGTTLLSWAIEEK